MVWVMSRSGILNSEKLSGVSPNPFSLIVQLLESWNVCQFRPQLIDNNRGSFELILINSNLRTVLTLDKTNVLLTIPIR